MDLDLKEIVSGAGRLAERFGDEAYFVALCIRSGMVRPELPHRIAQLLLAFERHGMLAGALAAGAIRHGDQVAVRDELGDITYKELDRLANAIANGWREEGLKPGRGVAVLARNHRWFLAAVFAAARCGARIILLNTSFSGPQIREVATREETDLLVYDDEYADMLEGVEPEHGRWLAWSDGGDGERTLAALAERSSEDTPPRVSESARITILTSGTTGTPKGAPRSEPRSLSVIGSLLDRVPFRAREVTELCAPMFHALGFAQALVAIGLGSTLVVRRHFKPQDTLDSVAENRATAMVMVPVMLQRLVDLGEEEINQRDLSSLRIVFLSGSALGPGLAQRALELLGPVVYNLYGSTEIAYATIATPEDLEAEPGTAGKVVRGSVVKILDEQGNEVEQGEKGRIFVGNLAQFEGYTGGGSKESVGGLMASGDMGHFDSEGRLFIDGRDDEMIVSGGENVFPAEVEEMLAKHEAVEEAAAIGVEDEKFGQRLKAFVVTRSGREVSEEELKDYVKDNLARYKVPREIVFLDELPRNSTGKVLKRELAEGGEDEGEGRDEDDGERKDEGQGAKAEAASGAEGDGQG